LKDISFEIQPGLKYAICGKNGAGKTTLLRLLLGLEKPAKGVITVENIILGNRTIKKIRQTIGFVFQNPDSQVFAASVYEDIAFGLRNMGKKEDEIKTIVTQTLEYVDMVEYVDHSPYQLSFGQKKRIAIAGILAMDPKIIVLDEPFSNLDYPSKKALKEILEKLVRNKKKTIIFATHNRKLIEEWADYALFLDDGRLISFNESQKMAEVPETEELLGPC